MDANASSAEKAAGLLQSLHLDSHMNVRDTLQVLQNPNANAQGGGLDSSGAHVAHAASMPPGYGGMEAGLYYPSNGFPPLHGYYIGGYDYAMSEWDNYLRHANAEGVEPQIRDSFDENGLLYHPSGFAYNSQHMYAPYPSGTPSRGDGQSYNASLGNLHAGNMYQQSALSNTSLIPFSVPINAEASVKNQGESSDKRPSNVASSNSNGHSGPRPAYTELVSYPHGRGIPQINARTLGSQDARVNYEDNRISTARSDLPKVAEAQQRRGSSSVSVSGHYGRPLTPLLPNVPTGQMYRPRVSVAPHAGALGSGFEPPVGKYSSFANPARMGTVAGLVSQGNGRHWYELDKGVSWGRVNVTPNTMSPHWDILNEQNKGPRTVRGRHLRTNPSAAVSSRSQGPANDLRESASLSMNKDQFNRPDFVTAHDPAKFFVIKSYSEDDIHKSIKYSTWASTVNGNKKLDTAYREAQASAKKPCPLFLFFSVNASGQFCGVAEMIGPVDFNSSLDFWQQDKWTGKLPVKWHIVKDVPNSQFRHIVLENNDNKPVTNSRDTQEVPLSQGSEMLNIFKTHGLKTSILDDFLFYETRQRFMQEKKARQQTHLQLHQIKHCGSKGIDEMPGGNEASQQGREFGQLADHNDKPSKSTDELDRTGKGGLSDNSQRDAS